MKGKSALIFSGGGMVSVYEVGPVQALIKEFNFTKPDFVFAGSGGAGTAAYYVAKQYGSINNIWLNLLSTKKFINEKRLNRILDIDYLIDVVFKKKDSLDVDVLIKSKTKLYISATNSKTGKTKNFLAGKNIFEQLRATKAIPIV